MTARYYYAGNDFLGAHIVDDFKGSLLMLAFWFDLCSHMHVNTSMKVGPHEHTTKGTTYLTHFVYVLIYM